MSRGVTLASLGIRKVTYAYVRAYAWRWPSERDRPRGFRTAPGRAVWRYRDSASVESTRGGSLTLAPIIYLYIYISIVTARPLSKQEEARLAHARPNYTHAHH